MGTCVTVERLSQVYETEPAYVSAQPRYLNMALQARTSLDPQALLECLKTVERDMGRMPSLRWGQRPIDLDILLFGDLQVESPDLRIPHARLHERPFVLQPLAELVPNLTPPGLSMTIGELARQAPPVGEIVACLGPL
jgi:2-amino-4-hydroxy-6-hydroxymethyldihydropteridine diphosphokinase